MRLVGLSSGLVLARVDGVGDAASAVVGLVGLGVSNPLLIDLLQLQLLGGNALQVLASLPSLLQ